MKTNKDIRIVFMGTPEFALTVLKTVTGAGYTVPLVFTQADKARGRGQNLCPSPVKAYAAELGIEVFTPEKLKNDETVNKLREADPDVILVAAYGKILPECVVAEFQMQKKHAPVIPIKPQFRKIKNFGN